MIRTRSGGALVDRPASDRLGPLGRAVIATSRALKAKHRAPDSARRPEPIPAPPRPAKT